MEQTTLENQNPVEQQQPIPQQPPVVQSAEPEINAQTDDVIIVYDKESKTAKAVAAVCDENGKTTQVDFDPQNTNQFVRITDKGMWSNFYTNLSSQYKDPTRFTMFRVPFVKLDQMKLALEKTANGADPSATKFLQNFKLATNGRLEKEVKAYTFDEAEIPWDKLGQWNLKKEFLKQSGILPKMLNGERSPLLQLSRRLDNVDFRGTGKLKFKRNRDGSVDFQIRTISNRPEFEDVKFGYAFSGEDKAKLTETLNMGRLADMVNPLTKEPMKCFVSYDEDLKVVYPIDASKVMIQKGAYGHTFDPAEMKTLESGGTVFVEKLKGRTDDQGNIQAFKGYLQFDANKGRVGLVHTLQERLRRRMAYKERQNGTTIYMLDPEKFKEQMTQQNQPDVKTFADYANKQDTPTVVSPDTTTLDMTQTLSPIDPGVVQTESTVQQTDNIQENKPSLSAVPPILADKKGHSIH